MATSSLQLNNLQDHLNSSPESNLSKRSECLLTQSPDDRASRNQPNQVSVSLTQVTAALRNLRSTYHLERRSFL